MVQEQEQGRSGKLFEEVLREVKIPKMDTLFPVQVINNKKAVVILGTKVIMLKRDYS